MNNKDFFKFEFQSIFIFYVNGTMEMKRAEGKVHIFAPAGGLLQGHHFTCEGMILKN